MALLGFKDKDGQWWCTVFGNEDQASCREKPGMVRVEFAEDGRIRVGNDRPDLVLQESARKSRRRIGSTDGVFNVSVERQNLTPRPGAIRTLNRSHTAYAVGFHL